MSILSTIGIWAAICILFGMALLIALLFRKVVPTNEVHIIQSGSQTMSYGKGEPAGNVYYAWPSWFPRIGVERVMLPISVFRVMLDSYASYDVGRIPFLVDIVGFFRIENSNVAAARIRSLDELEQQIEAILQGACRSILAKHDIEEILEGRSQFADAFTDAVATQLEEWGVANVKAIELMDIRDENGSKAIANIMAKKQSMIEKDSRMTVAENHRAAQEAEIAAKRDVDIRQQEDLQQVGVRTAEKEKQVAVAKEQAHQSIAEQAALTAEKNMAVSRVELVKAAEIERDKQVVQADQDKQTAIVRAEGERQQAIIRAEGQRDQITLVADGKLNEAKRNAEGIQAEGDAKASAEKAMQLASVVAQATLAEKIGENQGYQNYLISIRTVEANQVVGVAQADALKAADIKIIATGDGADSGMDAVSKILSPKTGTRLGGMMEGFMNTDAGKALVSAVTAAKEA